MADKAALAIWVSLGVSFAWAAPVFALSCCDGTPGQTNCRPCGGRRGPDITSAEYQVAFFSWFMGMYEQGRSRQAPRPAEPAGSSYARRPDCLDGFSRSDGYLGLCRKARAASGSCRNDSRIAELRGICDEDDERRRLVEEAEKYGGFGSISQVALPGEPARPEVMSLPQMRLELKHLKNRRREDQIDDLLIRARAARAAAEQALARARGSRRP